MTATVLVLRPSASALAGYLRLGHTGHRKLADLHAAGRFPFRRVVVDAAHFNEQKGLVRTLKASGCEVVLDPNFAEMATRGRFNSSTLKKLPWANPDRPWEPSDFGPHRNFDAAKEIASFAIEGGVDAVLAPTHLIKSADDPWRRVDVPLCEALRGELDRYGRSDIAVDYQLISNGAFLRDDAAIAALAHDFADLPIENVWLRISGFGATATGAGTRQFIESVRKFHGISKPLVADMVGGFAGLSTLAFGAVGGMCHGVCQKEGFDAADWHKPQSGGGSSARTYVRELDRYLKEEQLQALFDAKGKSRFGCTDTSCCPHGSDDMIENNHIHFLIQRHRQIDDFSKVPEFRRIDHFLLRHLDPAIRSARYADRLEIADEKVKTVVRNAKNRMVRLRDALADLDSAGHETHSWSSRLRSGAGEVSAVLGR